MRFIVACCFALGLACPAQAQTVGRYQLVPIATNNGTYMVIDTVTGQTWRLVGSEWKPVLYSHLEPGTPSFTLTPQPAR